MSEPAAGPPDGAEKGKKATTKAERRAIQEAQRAKKEAEQATKAPAKPKKEKDEKAKEKATPAKAAPAAGVVKEKADKKGTSGPAFTEPVKASKKPKPKVFVDPSDVHPAFLKLGGQYGDYSIRGGNARAIAMLVALKELIKDYKTPEDRTISRDLINQFNKPIQYLVNCRKMCTSMGNSLAYVKHKITKLFEVNPDCSDAEFKKAIFKLIDMFIYERIVYAARLIRDLALEKIKDGDVLLVYGRSSTVEMILNEAHEKNIKFKVMVVDSRPSCEGRELVNRLAAQNMQCTYVLISALSNVMGEVTKVFVGASAVLTNGNVHSRVGTALVCIMASAFHKPVMCCCETYKFTDKNMLNSLSNNEEGPSDLLVNQYSGDSPFPADWKDNENLSICNYQYDLTPAEHITMLITEVGMIPPTSVPVIIREYHLSVAV
eukprot:NODE_2119_length_1508_cov_49.644765_g2017_i0.p1 GENE.NODE_2119_length_1508_cov_49.644765_g2017_i0~~NODE_2119_length_1508_cov_49.644765_g2017_i0.p1  ORF type:complete len:449 (-),score=102.26 NODE_2119_length_1508_cov_49.644765_g2017_i0:160-1458(-)